jgi:hypothetical protein
MEHIISKLKELEVVQISNIKKDENLHKIFFEKFKRKSYSLLDIMLWINGLPETGITECIICGTPHKLKLTTTGNFPLLLKTCSRSCDLKRRHLDPQYSKNISNKSIETKNNTFIDGINMHLYAALKSAKTTKSRYSHEEISSYIKLGHSIKIEKTLQENTRRILNIIDYFGINRAICLSYRLNYKCNSLKLFVKFVNDIINYIKQPIEISEEDLIILFFEHLKNLKIKKICEYCGVEFNSIIIKDNLSYKIINSKCCSKSCVSKLNYKNNPNLAIETSNRMKLKLQDDEYRKVLLEYGKKGWENRNPKEWIIKYLATMGQSGIDDRTRKIQQTKFDNGHISFVGELNKSSYSEYKKSVYRFTNAQNLSILENIEYRSKSGYHLDHIFPISRGFCFNIPAELIGHIDNLIMIPAKENQEKSNSIIKIPEHILNWLILNDSENYIKVMNEIIKN